MLAFFTRYSFLELFNPNLVGFLGLGFEIGEEGGGESKPPHPSSLKLVRIMLEVEIWYVSTYTYLGLENILLVPRPSCHQFFRKKISIF